MTTSLTTEFHPGAGTGNPHALPQRPCLALFRSIGGTDRQSGGATASSRLVVCCILENEASPGRVSGRPAPEASGPTSAVAIGPVPAAD